MFLVKNEGALFAASCLFAALFATVTASAEPIAMLTSEPNGSAVKNRLLFADTDTPNTIKREVTISGLPTGWSLRAIDVRPSNGQLYGLAAPDGIIDSQALYRINPSTGAATIVGTASDVIPTGSATADMDFDPETDTLHAATGASAAYWLANPDTGDLISPLSQTLRYAPGNGTDPPYVAGLAFDHNVAGSALRTLYGIDRKSAQLVRIGGVSSPPTAPDMGVVSGIGPLNAMVSGSPLVLGNQIGFDISPSGLAIATLSADTTLVGYIFRVDLATGATTMIGSGGVGDLIDIAFPGPKSFYTVSPCRVIDTRTPPPGSPLVAGSARVFAIAGQCGIPLTARDVSLNVTVTGSTAAGHLTLYPSGSAVPSSSTINYGTGKTRANNAVTLLGSSGDLTILGAQAAGTVHVVVDVNGYME